MFKSKIHSLSILAFIFLFSCGLGYHPPESFEYSKKIIGKWQQIRSFNLANDPESPIGYDWIVVQDGFTLGLNTDGTFEYTKYGNCTTGKYIFYPNFGRIEFNFDCEINSNGESVTKIIELINEDVSQNNQLFLDHPRSSDICKEDCMSILKRIE